MKKLPLIGLVALVIGWGALLLDFGAEQQASTPESHQDAPATPASDPLDAGLDTLLTDASLTGASLPARASGSSAIPRSMIALE